MTFFYALNFPLLQLLLLQTWPQIFMWVVLGPHLFSQAKLDIFLPTKLKKNIYVFFGPGGYLKNLD